MIKKLEKKTAEKFQSPSDVLANVAAQHITHVFAEMLVQTDLLHCYLYKSTEHTITVVSYTISFV